MFGKLEDQLNALVTKAEDKQEKNFAVLIQRLDRIIYLLSTINNKENLLMATIQDVQTAVSAQTTVENSVVTLLNGINQQLATAIAANDPAALDAVVASITANTTILSNAVTANTPVTPVTPTVPVVTPSA